MQNSNWEDANCIACMVKYMYIYMEYMCVKTGTCLFCLES